jgi:hypothetical protein
MHKETKYKLTTDTGSPQEILRKHIKQHIKLIKDNADIKKEQIMI